MDGQQGSPEMSREVELEKSYFDVLGLCCSSEVPLIENTLRPLEGVHKVSVIVPSKTVIVVHDPLLISQLQIGNEQISVNGWFWYLNRLIPCCVLGTPPVKALNQAKLEATVRAYGQDKIIKKWPSPHILASGLLLLISMFKHFFHPLKWLAIAAVVVGLPSIALRSVAAIRRCTLDINILMLMAGKTIKKTAFCYALSLCEKGLFLIRFITQYAWNRSFLRFDASCWRMSLGADLILSFVWQLPGQLPLKTTQRQGLLCSSSPLQSGWNHWLAIRYYQILLDPN